MTLFRIRTAVPVLAAALGLVLLAGCFGEEQETRTAPVEQTEPPSNDANAGAESAMAPSAVPVRA